MSLIMSRVMCGSSTLQLRSVHSSEVSMGVVRQAGQREARRAGARAHR